MLQHYNHSIAETKKKNQLIECMKKQLGCLAFFFQLQKTNNPFFMSLILKENSQVEENVNEKNDIISVAQLRNEENNLKNGSLMSNSSFFSMSLVNVHYKYEELLSSYNGLLEVLDMRNVELGRCREENKTLKKTIEELNSQLENSTVVIESLRRKIQEVKRRKKEKIQHLRYQRETLALVHDRLVAILHKQCLEKNRVIDYHLKNADIGVNALLLKEIRKNNILSYKNFQLQQEIELIKTNLKISKSGSNSSIGDY